MSLLLRRGVESPKLTKVRDCKRGSAGETQREREAETVRGQEEETGAVVCRLQGLSEIR